MKQFILLLSTICIALSAPAQGPKLVGITSEGGLPVGAGTIIQYTGGATSVTQVDVLSLGNPQNCTLTEAPNGKLYGIVDDGGPANLDAIIEYDYTANTYKVVANFDTATGLIPGGSLLLVGDSTFYGLAYLGGANNGGTIFSYTIGAAITKLADLPPTAYPYGSLMQASDGNLYGLTQDDGAHRSGTIFRYNIDSATYTPLYSLPSYSHPLGSLLEAGTDTLYGMAYNDSLHIPNTGYIFSYIISSGIFNQLYFFPGTNTFSEGSLIRATDGLLYGMTTNGGSCSTGLYSGGTLFSFNTGFSTVDTLHNFGSANDGAGPMGDLYQASDGILYGMTNSGGISGSHGTIFQYDITTHTYSLNVNLTGSTGYYPGYGHLTEYHPLQVTAITDVKAYQFSLYPNPTSGPFTIQHNYTGKVIVQIINLLGERLKEFYMTGNQNQFDISDLAAGIYEIQLSDGTQMLKVMKMVKE